jgi:hypothetical protein
MNSSSNMLTPGARAAGVAVPNAGAAAFALGLLRTWLVAFTLETNGLAA